MVIVFMLNLTFYSKSLHLTEFEMVLSASPLSLALQCDDGLVYEACGSACSEVCPGTSPSVDSHCSALSCVEGCFCPQGTVHHGQDII